MGARFPTFGGPGASVFDAASTRRLTALGAEKYGFRMRFVARARTFRPWVVAALTAAVTSVGAFAHAEDDDRALTETALREVEASPRKSIAREPISRSKEATERAKRLREVRDEPRARLCDGLARTWAEVARDVIRAADAEARASSTRANASDAGAQVDRERAQLEEGLGQAGRLRAQLEALENESKRSPDRTSSVAKEDTKAAIPGDVPEPKGAPKGPPKPKSPEPKAAPKAAPSKGGAR